MTYEIRGRKLTDHIDNEKALEPLLPVLEMMDGLDAGNSDYHNEKDLLEHSLMVYEEMLEMNDSDTALLMALSHDIGKILTQHKSNCAKHDLYGKDIIENLYYDQDVDEEIVEALKIGCEQHIRIKHINGWQGQAPMKESKVISTAKYYHNRVDLDRLLQLIQADVKGRKPTQSVDHETIRNRLEKAEEVINEVDKEYVLEKRNAEESEFNQTTINGMITQDRVELLKEKQDVER